MSTPSAFFVSDAHLGVSSRPERRRQSLCRFLDSIAESADQLFLVGDIFDFWIEYGPFIRGDFFPVLHALAGLRHSGVSVHYIAGNHDFALGSFLRAELGIQIYQEGFTGEMQGRRLSVVHGDGLLEGDWAYRLMRRVLRNRLNQRLYCMLHPAIGVRLAGWASRTSRRFSRGKPDAGRRERYRTVARRLLGPDADLVVMGHSHCADLVEGEPGTYCNTGEWMGVCTYAKLTEGVMSLWRYHHDRPAEQIQADVWK